MKTISIVLADDHKILRQGIAQVIDSQDDMHVLAQASNGEETISLVEELHPDILILDINMPGINGLEAAKIIREKYPAIKILMLTMYKNDEYVFQAIEAGVDGYLLKEAEMKDLLAAVRAVANGESFIDPSITGRVFAKLRGQGAPKPKTIAEQLPERDQEILKLLAQGMANNDIAENLFITEKTVRNRLSMIFKLLNLKNRTEAALWAVENGFSSPD